MVSRFALKALFAWIILVLMTVVTPARAAPGELTLERVMLSSGGVGYFEYAAEIEGDAELALRVRLDQVDDVLKSIVVYDDAGGVGQVRLPGREPLAQAFRDMPFGPAALESTASLLNALQGARLRASGDANLEGRILRARAETVVLPDGLGTTLRHRVSLITPQGVRQFILEQAETVAFVDPELQARSTRRSKPSPGTGSRTAAPSASAPREVASAASGKNIHAIVHDLEKQLFLAAHVMIEPRLGQPYRLGDFLHGGALKTLLVKDSRRPPADFAPPPFCISGHFMLLRYPP